MMNNSIKANSTGNLTLGQFLSLSLDDMDNRIESFTKSYHDTNFNKEAMEEAISILKILQLSKLRYYGYNCNTDFSVVNNIKSMKDKELLRLYEKRILDVGTITSCIQRYFDDKKISHELKEEIREELIDKTSSVVDVPIAYLTIDNVERLFGWVHDISYEQAKWEYENPDLVRAYKNSLKNLDDLLVELRSEILSVFNKRANAIQVEIKSIIDKHYSLNKEEESNEE